MMRDFGLLKSDFLRNVSYQMIGTGLAQLLPFAVAPILTRLYSEEDFALYTTFFAVASVLVVGAGGRYQFAIVLPRKNSEAIKVFTLSIYITVFYSVLLLMVSLLIHSSLDLQLGSIIYFIPPYVLLFGIWTSFSYLSVRNKTFLSNATAKVLQSVFNVIGSIGFGLFKITSFGLIIGRIIGALGSWLYLHRKSSVKTVFPKFGSLLAVAKKYQDYPIYGLIPAFLDIASVQGVVLILAKFYSISDLGYFGLTILILSAPLGLISGSFRDVFYQKITSQINNNQFNEAISMYKKSALGLFLIGLPVCIIIFMFGPEIFRVVFGEKWIRSGEFASLLSFSFLIQLIVSPLSSIFNASNKLKIASIWQTFYFFSTFATLGLSSIVLRLSIEDLLMVYVIHEVALYSIYFALQYWTLKRLS